MKYNFFFLILFSTWLLQPWNEINDTYNNPKSIVHSITNDTLIKVPILEIQDTALYNTVYKIVKFMDLKKQKYLINVQNHAVIRIAYYAEDIYIAFIPDVSILFENEDPFPKGVITLGGYDFFFYDPFELVPSFVKGTTLFKYYEYKPKSFVELIEFDEWVFTITDYGIELKDFYPLEEIYKNHFIEIYNK